MTNPLSLAPRNPDIYLLLSNDFFVFGMQKKGIAQILLEEVNNEKLVKENLFTKYLKLIIFFLFQVPKDSKKSTINPSEPVVPASINRQEWVEMTADTRIPVNIFLFFWKIVLSLKLVFFFFVGLLFVFLYLKSYPP